jgi:hypothetical protein
MNNKIVRFCAISGCLLLMALWACNPQKKIIKEPIKEKGADFLFQQLKKNEFQFDYLNIKFSADFDYKKNSNSVNGTMRIRKDSAIWMSVTPALGLEAFRLLITQDSVKMLNRLDNTYFTGSFKYLNKMLSTNIDFDMLQALLTGNDFSLYQGDVFKANVDNKLYKLSTVGRGKLKKYIATTEDSLRLLMQDIWLDPETYKISKVMLKELKENQKLEANYSDFQKVDSLSFPHSMNFDLSNPNEKIVINIDMNKVSKDGPREFPFNVGSKYKKILN